MCLWGVGIGLLLSYVLKTTLTVYLLIPMIIIPQLVYSGALINFKSFNKIFNADSEIPLAATVVPMRWAAEGVIVDFYTSNPYYSRLFINRCELYNATYYSDFFIPEVESLMQKDSLRAIKILNSEQNSTGFISGYESSMQGLSELKNQYAYIKFRCIEKEDSILQTYSDVLDSKLKFSNIAVSNIVNNSSNQVSIIDAGNFLIRDYKPTYMLPDMCRKNNTYLLGFKDCRGITLRTAVYNLLVLWSLVFLNVLILLVIFSLNKYCQKRGLCFL